MSSRRSLLAGLSAAALAGCGGPPAPAVVDMTASAAPDVNRSADGTPQPVAVRLYGLSSTGRFSAATSYSLIDRDTAVLGDEGSRAEEIVVRPGETRKITLMPKPNVRYIGAVVLFQDIDHAQWRTMVPIASNGLTTLRLAVGANTVRLEVA